MTHEEALTTLQKLGTAQNIKTYRRHGAGKNVYGVSFANLKVLVKKIKADHALAKSLWQTGNCDARTLALMIADPSLLTVSEAEAWLKEADYKLLVDYIAAVVARSQHANRLRDKWMKSKQESPRQAGYAVLCYQLRDAPESVDPSYCRELLATLESQIHSSPNLARNAMNTALISIGVAVPELREATIETAKRIGKVEVDHGDTACKTPDAVEYILKTANRKPRRVC